MKRVDAQVFSDLQKAYADSQQRRIVSVAKWCAEMICNLAGTTMVQPQLHCDQIGISEPFAETSLRYFAQSCIDCKEFDRAANLLQGQKSPVNNFLHYYARYLASEKQRLENLADVLGSYEKDHTQEADSLTHVLTDLSSDESDDDAWILYLRGVLLRKQGLAVEAERALLRSLQLNPLFWGAWCELTHLVKTKEHLLSFQLPDHWLKDLFLLGCYVALHLTTDALDCAQELCNAGFSSSTWVIQQMAEAHHILRNHDQSIELFANIRKSDPYRLDGMDVYSNSLFVRGMRVELASLAHHLYEFGKYTSQTCCVVGNYFSLRGEHERSVQYFQRALKLEPDNAGAWTLMAHEFLELQNNAAAILAYRRALDIDPKDYRAWYGLGQNYEIMKMYSFALYYYSFAHKLRSDDSRTIVALGEMYEKLNKLSDAVKCYWTAHTVGDMEGRALVKLGRLYETMKDSDQAAAVYSRYLQQQEELGTADDSVTSNCFKFLAEYYLNKEELDQAHEYAQQCLAFDSVKEEAKGILKKISSRRAAQSFENVLESGALVEEEEVLSDELT